jgi:hypothetical protein
VAGQWQRNHRIRAGRESSVKTVIACTYTSVVTYWWLQVKCEWDQNKNKQNFKKHGISFEMASRVFVDTHALDRMQIGHDDEERRETIGIAHRATILFVA